MRCDRPLRSLEVAEFLLLLGTENFANLGLHAGVREDQPCQQTCFCIGESFDLLLIRVFTPMASSFSRVVRSAVIKAREYAVPAADAAGKTAKIRESAEGDPIAAPWSRCF